MAAYNYDKDPNFLAELDKIRVEYMSGPDPEHLQKVFPDWNGGFQMQVTKIIQDGATSKEAMVLLRPPPPGDLLPWLSVLFGLQLLDLESHWKPSHILEKPDWMMGNSLVLSLVYHARLGSTAELRDGLHHQAYRNLLEKGTESRQGRGFERYSEPSGFPFRDRTCMCFVVTPIGLPLFTFRNTSELLVVLRDAIQAHRDLLQNANILHRDISGANILINEGTRRGMLIDFDVAIDLSQRTPTARNIAGTLDYSAAGLLKENPHTYRHDLESSFYVFIQALTRKEGRLPANSRFRRWTTGDWEQATEARVEDMSRENFPLLLDEWDGQFESCKTLAWTLRHLLFGDEDELFWGTDTSKNATDALYDGFLEAFDQAILGYESAWRLE